MHTISRRQGSYASLVLLLAADVVAMAAFLLDQWFEAPGLLTWLGAAGIAVVAMPALLMLADKVFEAARMGRNVPIAGGTFP